MLAPEQLKSHWRPAVWGDTACCALHCGYFWERKQRPVLSPLSGGARGKGKKKTQEKTAAGK